MRHRCDNCESRVDDFMAEVECLSLGEDDVE